ncbi:MAG: hypothetical protein C4291_09515 [Candidatus Dadabacteria bacterium]
MGNLIEVAKTGDIELGQSICVEIEDKRIAIFNIGGNYYAIDDACTHVGGPLSEGECEEYVVTCPWHGARFNIKTGDVLSPPAKRPIKSYRVQVERDSIKVEI